MIDTKPIAGYITILQPNLIHQKIPFYHGTNIIGRSSTKATVVINQASISQKHAKLIVGDNKMIILDLDSKNGIRINGDLNLIEKNKQFIIDESMIIYLAEAKCKFEMLKQTNRSQFQKNKKMVNERQKVKNNKQLFPLFEQDESKSKNKIESKNKSTNDVILSKKLEQQKEKGKKLKIDQGPKESDNVNFTFQKINGQKNLQIADDINQKNKQKNTKKLNIINQNTEQKEPFDTTEPQEEQEKLSKEKEIKTKKEKKKVVKSDKQEEKSKKKQVQKSKKTEKTEKSQSTKKESQRTKVQISPKKGKQEMKKNQQKLKNKQQRQNQIKEKRQKSKASKEKNKKQKQTSQNKNTKNQTFDFQRSGDKTKRVIKRLPSQSLEKQIGIVPKRSTYINKRILTSGFQLLLAKKYFLAVESIDDDYDYLIMKSYLRTFKALFSISKGILIVKNQWIKDSQFFEKIMDVQNYLFEEVYYIYDAIKRVRLGQRIFKNYQFYLASSQYHIQKKEIQCLIEACGGISINKLPQKQFKEKQNQHKIAIIKNYSKIDEVKDEVKNLKALGFVKIYTIEMILDSCEKQQINWKTNDVFGLIK